MIPQPSPSGSQARAAHTGDDRGQEGSTRDVFDAASPPASLSTIHTTTSAAANASGGYPSTGTPSACGARMTPRRCVCRTPSLRQRGRVREKCGCGKTITDKDPHHERDRQRPPWQSTRWAKSYNRRGRIEGLFGAVRYPTHPRPHPPLPTPETATGRTLRVRPVRDVLRHHICVRRGT